MRLIDLHPQFIRYESVMETYRRVIGDPLKWKPGDPDEEVTAPREHKVFVASLPEAQGIRFWCPKCSGAHEVEVTFRNRGVPDALGTHNKKGEAVRWDVTGTDYGDLTTKPSILIESGCEWHGFITNGGIE